MISDLLHPLLFPIVTGGEERKKEKKDEGEQAMTNLEVEDKLERENLL